MRTLVKKIRLKVAFLAVLSLLFVQGSGLHLHVHQHAGPHDASASESVHLSLADTHQDSHAQDHDKELFSPGPIKSQDQGQKLLALAVTLALKTCPLLYASPRPLFASNRPYSSPPRYLRPPLRGPPL